MGEDQSMQAETNQRESVHRRERGASIVEYALLLALMALVAIAAIKTVGSSTESVITDVNDEIALEDCERWQKGWDDLLEMRAAHRSAGTWVGSANRPNRIAWVSLRNDLNVQKTTLGC